MIRGPELYVVIEQEGSTAHFLDIETPEGDSINAGGRVIDGGLVKLGPFAQLDPDSCLGKAAATEPLFVLRAQDITAPFTVREWARLNEARLGPLHPKIVEARACALAMEQWAPRKMPD